MADLWRRFLRFGFRLLYNELAFTYDLVSVVVSLGAWRCWQRSSLKHLSIPPGSCVLELAHGTGNLQLDLYARGYVPVGYDLSPFMGRIASRKLRQRQLEARLVRGTAQQLPFGAATFPAVVCTFPTDFIFIPETLREVHRILKPGGLLVIVPNGVLTGRGISDRAIEWLYRATGQRGGQFQVGTFFAQYGFKAEIQQENCPRSVATVIIAQKLP